MKCNEGVGTDKGVSGWCNPCPEGSGRDMEFFGSEPCAACPAGWETGKGCVCPEKSKLVWEKTEEGVIVGSCVCEDPMYTFSTADNKCVCKSDYGLWNGECVDCSSLNYTLQNGTCVCPEGSSCTCPEGTVFVEGDCVDTDSVTCQLKCKLPFKPLDKDDYYPGKSNISYESWPNAQAAPSPSQMCGMLNGEYMQPRKANQGLGVSCTCEPCQDGQVTYLPDEIEARNLGRGAGMAYFVNDTQLEPSELYCHYRA